MSEWKESDKRKENVIRRSFCELVLGALMLILVAIINLRTDERPLLLQSVWSAADEEQGGESSLSAADTEKEKRSCVVLDAGHGAADPGKIGCNDAREKDINLAIVLKLKQYLEAEKVKVVLTRESDEPLYEDSAVNKKMSDMNARVSMIESTKPDLVVSIHQNSYHESSVCGPQVFYYKASEKGKMAAECLQASFDGLEEIDNRRQAKANDNYYLLLHTSAPMVIAECGFLSNPGEAELLIQDSYQDKLAQVLCRGIMEYLRQSGAGQSQETQPQALNRNRESSPIVCTNCRNSRIASCKKEQETV
ncbi:MAG: N-acetylmuramoyl-L-alanine amidase [Lachnospiraceae bacterium]